MSYRLGVDVGGTFTDFLLINESDGSTYTAVSYTHLTLPTKDSV